MNRRKRYLVAVPVIALLLVLAVVSLRWGLASLDLWRATEISAQLQQADVPDAARLALLERGFKHLEHAQALAGGHADVHDKRGQLLYWQAMNVADDWEQRNRLLDEASEQFREALKVRPLWPYFWANLVVSKAERGIFDGEFRRAVRRSVETGPWEPRVQLQLLRVDFIEQQRLDKRSRAYIDETLARALQYQPLQVFELAADLGQLPRVCGKPGAALLAGQCRAAGVLLVD